ncbi:MAG TPA: hypothetical protein VFK59_00800 [Actinomycetota bacterium]|nr:hypothetical protein [Actinomycetota bacterium]
MTRPRTLSIGLASALAAVAAFGLVACSEDEDPATLLPSSAFPQDTGSTSGPPTGVTGSTGATGLPTGSTGLPTGATGNLPTTAPSGEAGNLTDGQAAITVTGDVQATKALTSLVSSVYAPPPGGMAVVWTAGGTDATTFGLGGLSFTGSQPTASTLSLTLTVQTENELASFTSTGGECTVTMGIAGADQIAGVFTCSDLVGSQGEVVDVSGSFAAQG